MREETRGLDDAKILALAFADDRILMTEDRDFGLLIYRNRHPTHGVILVAASAFALPTRLVAEHVVEVLDNLDTSCVGRFTTIEPGRVRQRSIENEKSDG